MVSIPPTTPSSSVTVTPTLLDEPISTMPERPGAAGPGGVPSASLPEKSIVKVCSRIVPSGSRSAPSTPGLLNARSVESRTSKRNVSVSPSTKLSVRL